MRCSSVSGGSIALQSINEEGYAEARVREPVCMPTLAVANSVSYNTITAPNETTATN